MANDGFTGFSFTLEVFLLPGEKSRRLIKQLKGRLAVRGGRLVEVQPRRRCGGSKSPLDKTEGHDK